MFGVIDPSSCCIMDTGLFTGEMYFTMDEATAISVSGTELDLLFVITEWLQLL